MPQHQSQHRGKGAKQNSQDFNVHTPCQHNSCSQHKGSEGTNRKLVLSEKEQIHHNHIKINTTGNNYKYITPIQEVHHLIKTTYSPDAHPYRPSIQEDLALANYVCNTKQPNAFLARVKLTSNWNLQLLHTLCESTPDRKVLTFLTYGWPISHQDLSLPSITTARKYPEHIDRYIQKELQHGTLAGPLASLPFITHMAVSPMSTRDKREPGKKRVLAKRGCWWIVPGWRVPV